MNKIFIFLVAALMLSGISLAQRLPTVSSDTDTWGTVLNTYLQTEHGPNGTHTNITATGLNVSNETHTLLYVNESGNVGIGTDNPDDLLHIEGSEGELIKISDGTRDLLITSASDTFNIKGDNSNTYLGLAPRNNQNNILLTPSAALFYKLTQPATDDNVDLGSVSNRWNQLFVGTGDSSFAGNVGINTTTPSTLLTVNGNQTHSAIFMNGSVGIGTTTPEATLDLGGGSFSLNTANGVTLNDSNGISFYTSNEDYKIGFDSQGGTTGYLRYNVDSKDSDVHGHIFSAGDLSPGTQKDLLYIRSDGNIGIGIIDPISKLHVYGTSAVGELITKFENNASGATPGSLRIYQGPDAELSLITSGVNVTSSLQPLYYKDSFTATTDHAGRQGSILSFGGGGFNFQTVSAGTDQTSTSLLLLDENGNIGINTTNPENPLHVNSSAAIPLRLETDGSYPQIQLVRTGTADWRIGTASNTFNIEDNVNSFVSVQTDGNVAIGQVAGDNSLAASAKLHIRGDAGNTVPRLIVQGAGIQIADLVQWQDNNSNVLGVINNSGSMAIGKSFVLNPYRLDVNGSIYTNGNMIYAGYYLQSSATQSNFYKTKVSQFDADGSIAAFIVASSPATPANLTEWQNSTGSVLAYVNTSGDMFISGSQVCTGTNGVCTGSWTDDGENVTTTRNVGIGTTNPLTKLQVIGDIWFGNTNAPVLRWRNETNEFATARIDSGTDFYFEVTGAGEVLRLANDGDVGLGTTSPQALLHINGSGALLNITNKTHSFVVVDSLGNVGIGETNPTAKLDIQYNAANYVLDIGNPAGSAYGIKMSLGGSNSVSSALNIDTNAGNVLDVQTDGRIGIGTDDATETLEVNGTFLVNQSDSVGLFVNGTHVGVGTVVPSNILHIYGNDSRTRYENIGGQILVTGVDNGGNAWIGQTYTATNTFLDYSGSFYARNTSQNSKFSLSQSGVASFTNTVGINTTTPTSTLTIVGNVEVGNSTIGQRGITLYNETNDPYCVFINGSSLNATSGACSF